jgi:hypothetical protein
MQRGDAQHRLGLLAQDRQIGGNERDEERRSRAHAVDLGEPKQVVAHFWSSSSCSAEPGLTGCCLAHARPAGAWLRVA